MKNLLCALLVLVGLNSFGQVAVRSLDGAATNLTAKPSAPGGVALTVTGSLDTRGGVYGDGNLLTNLNLTPASNYVNASTSTLAGTLVPRLNGTLTNPTLVDVQGYITFPLPDQVIFAGDSLSTYTVGAYDGWTKFFTNRMSLFGLTNAINLAVSGRKTQDVWDNYAAEITPHAPNVTGIPTLLILLVGIDDLGTYTVDQSWTAASNIVKQAKTEGFEVAQFTLFPVWGQTYARNQQIEEFNSRVRGNTNLNYLIDAANFFAYSGDTNLTYDGLHTTDTGARLIELQVEWSLLLGRTWLPVASDHSAAFLKSKKGFAIEPTFTNTTTFADGALTLTISSNSNTMRIKAPSTNMTIEAVGLIWNLADMIPASASSGAQIRVTSTNVVMGKSIFLSSTNIKDTVGIGAAVGLWGKDHSYMTLLGDYSGAALEGNKNGTVLVGYHAGGYATNANESLIAGTFAGQYATASQYATILGHKAGRNSTNSTRSIYIGYQAGSTNNRDNTLVIDSQDATSGGSNAFMYGELDNRKLTVNGTMVVTGATTFETNVVVSGGGIGIGTNNPTVPLDVEAYTSTTTGLSGILRSNVVIRGRLAVGGDNDTQSSHGLDVRNQTIFIGGTHTYWHSRSNLTTKSGYIIGPCWTNTDQLLIMNYSAGSGGNTLSFGGSSASYKGASTLQFFTTPFGQNGDGVAEMTITSGGLVGFGTNVAQQPVHVSTFAANSDALIRTENDLQPWCFGTYGSDAYGNDPFIVRDAKNSFNVMTLYPMASGSGGIIFTNGRWGFGVTAPGTTLSVGGGIQGTSLELATAIPGLFFSDTDGGAKDWHVFGNTNQFTIRCTSDSRNDLTIDTSGCVGIGTNQPSPSYTLYLAGPTGGNLYATGAVSCLEIIDHTPAPLTLVDAYAIVASHESKDGKVNHAKLSPLAYGTKKVQVPTGRMLTNSYPQSVEVNDGVTNVTPARIEVVAEMKFEVQVDPAGRNLSMVTSAQAMVINDLTDRMKKLELMLYGAGGLLALGGGAAALRKKKVPVS